MEVLRQATAKNSKSFKSSKTNEYNYTAEEQAIIDKAKKDGTYMKAPNGKESNLTERQWVQVRTKAFKEWFGDWEKTARIEKLRRSGSIVATGEEYKDKYELNNKFADNYIKDNLRGEYTNKDTGDKIKITRRGAEKVTRHDADNEIHLKSIALIPQMLEEAIFITEETNEKEKRGFDSYRYYVVGLKIGGVDYTAKMVVGVKDGQTYYDHALTEISKEKLLEGIDEIKRPFANKENFNGKDTRLFSILSDNSSKIVDENGEPKVVYHGSLQNFNIKSATENTGAFSSENDDIRFSKRNDALIETYLRNSPNYSDEILQAFKTYVEEEQPVTQLAMAKWTGNGVIRLPEDRPTVDEALKICRKDKLDPIKYNAPGEIIKEWRDRNAKDEDKDTREYLSPDDKRFAGVLTSKVDYGNGITVYDVQDSKAGQQAVRELMNDHLTVDGNYYNCWCLLYSDNNGKLSDSSWGYWNNYTGTQKKVAFKDGKIISFCASYGKKSEWWDLSDRSYGENIPVEAKIPNDKLNRSALMDFNPKTKEFTVQGRKFR
ncbi:MAG: hypothetical protein Q4Q06_08175, partial [Bacteroidota bacterium]|nr:hypothetical protein [Bacteroidota bacterium]